MADTVTEGVKDPKDTKTTDEKAKDVDSKVDDKAGSDSKDEGGELAGAFEGDEDKSKDGGDKGKAPVAGELKLEVPEALRELVGDVGEYLAAFREGKTDQEKLNKLMAVHFDRVKVAAEEWDRQAESMGLEWRRELTADEKLGGANLKQTITIAERGARALGGSTLAVALTKYLKGEEPISGAMLVRAFHMAGLTQSEDRLGKAGAEAKGDEALTPDERTFKATHPKTWERIQAEKRARAG